MLFDCSNDELGTEHNKWHGIMQNMLPCVMLANMEHMTSKQKIRFILSGLRESYLQEWEYMYVIFSDFIGLMYCVCGKLNDSD